MLNLILKDLLTQKNVLAAMFLYIFFSMIIFGSGLLVSTMFVVSSLLLIMSCERDDKNNSNRLWNSLAVPKWKIVGAKYLSILVYAVLTIPAYWLTRVILSFTTLDLAPVRLPDVISGMILALLFAGVALPLFFAFGYRVTAIVLVFLALLGFGALTIALPQGPALIMRFLQWRDTLAPQLALILLGVAALAASVVSFGLALFAYSRREFV